MESKAVFFLWLSWTPSTRFSGRNLETLGMNGFSSIEFLALGILAHLLRMVLEPKYLAEEVIVHSNHPLTSWLDPYRVGGYVHQFLLLGPQIYHSWNDAAKGQSTLRLNECFLRCSLLNGELKGQQTP